MIRIPEMPAVVFGSFIYQVDNNRHMQSIMLLIFIKTHS